MKYIERLAFFAAVLLTVSVTPALALGATYITLDHWSGHPGPVTVSGGGFLGGDTVTIQAGSYASVSATSSEFGELAPVSLVLPASTPEGSLTITGTGAPSGLSASNSFYVVQFHPAISVSGDSHTPGTAVLVSGSGYAPNESVILSLSTASSSVMADTSGNFTSASFILPVTPAGTYALTGTGAGSGASAQTYYYVGGFYPSAQPSAYYVAPGGTLTFSGSGFAPSEHIDISADGIPAGLASFDADAHGAFDHVGALAIPFSFAGSVKNFHAHGALSGADASVMVTIGSLYPSLTPSAYYVSPGSTLSFSGAGFGGSEEIQIFEGASSSSLASATATGGAFSSSSVMIPYSFGGSAHLFRAHGMTSGADASVSVTVGRLYPSLMPSSYFVLMGYPFNLSGTGFAPGETINFTVGGATSTVSATTNSSGNFFLAGPFRAPAGMSGLATVNAAGLTSGTQASVTLTIGQLYPVVTPSDYWLYPLQNFDFRGSGFIPEENVRISVGSSTVATVTANAFGNFVQSLTAPGRSGSSDYTFTGETSGATARVTVTVAGLYPTISAYSYYVAPGEGVMVQGTGFLNNEPVRIDVRGVAVATTTANGVGNVAPIAVRMPVASGTAEVRMTGLTSGATAATTITLIPFAPQVTPSIWYGVPGAAISFSGSGFAPSESVTFTVNGTSTQSATTTAAGALSVTGLSLPFGGTTARYQFTGSVSGGVATLDVTVAALHPWAWLDTYYAPPGMPLVVSGRGFASGEGITISADGTAFATSTTDASGGFDLGTRVPQAPAGDRVIRATGDRSGATGQTGMTIAPQYLDFQLESYAVAPGGTVHFMGGGYVPGETLELRTDRTGETVIASALVDSAGHFDATYALPPSTAPGPLTFTARGIYSQSPKSIALYVTGG